MILARWGSYLCSVEPLNDESIYLQAFQAVAAGRSPYSVGGFYYPATFAALGGWLIETLGEPATRWLLKLLSILGLASTMWVSLSLWEAPWGRRFLVAAAYLSLSPAVLYGIETGNISFAVIGSVLVALAIWSAQPWPAGILLGSSSAIKPLAPLAILALLFHRPVPATRRHLFAGVAAAAVAAMILLSDPEYLGTSAQAMDRLPFIRSFSLNRILLLMNLEVSPVVVAAGLGALICLVARLCPMDRKTLICYGGLAAVLAVPIIWSHTLLLTLPLQVLALTRAVSRHRQRQDRATGENEDWRTTCRRYELIFVILAVVALQFTEGLGAIDDQAVLFQIVILSGAYLAAPALMSYVLITKSNSIP